MNTLMKKNPSSIRLLLVLVLAISGCVSPDQADGPADRLEQLREHPEWSRNANIYEVNIRQYTPEGTFNAFREHLPRLKEMGVDILWLMPIHPIGEKNRKGELGSYYSIRDYKAVNPNFGTLQDFKALVEDAHRQGMKLIIDWVPNHTAWDHPWVSRHPEYYAKDEEGNITYEADWTDIALLNYENRELWDQMIDRLAFWIKEAAIDGYRVDHASHEIPMAFWQKAIPTVDSIASKEVFWLAEWDDPKLHPWFDASYSWEYKNVTYALADGEATLSNLQDYLEQEDSRYPDHAYRLYFTTNHDENSWEGSDEELFGKNFRVFSVMAATIDGIPLIYSGQETGLDEQLEFFKKDTIRWDDYEHEAFYRTLLSLKDRNETLWNGQYGGDYRTIYLSDEDQVLAYRRMKGNAQVLVLLNFSATERELDLKGRMDPGRYGDIFTGDTLDPTGAAISLAPHGYRVLEKL